MPTNIVMDRRFLYLGASKDALDLAIPFPSKDKGVFETSRMVDSGRSAQGAVVGQQIGRSVDKQSMEWAVMDCGTWWEINNFLEHNGLFFWCRYFSHNHGEWRVRRFYANDPKCTPYGIDPETGMPEFYVNCSLNVIDMGE